MKSSNPGNSLFTWPLPLQIAITFVYLAALGVFAYFASTVDNFPGEVAVSSWVQAARTPWLDAFMTAFSALGTTIAGTVTVLAACAILYIRGWHIESVLLLPASITGQIVALIVKQLVARPRPAQGVVEVLQEANSFSFPSNHVMIYTVFLGMLVFLLNMKVRPTVGVRSLQALFVMILLLTGFSRIYLGVHWLSDVAAGYAFGLLVVFCATWVWVLLVNRKAAKQD